MFQLNLFISFYSKKKKKTWKFNENYSSHTITNPSPPQRSFNIHCSTVSTNNCSLKTIKPVQKISHKIWHGGHIWWPMVYFESETYSWGISPSCTTMTLNRWSIVSRTELHSMSASSTWWGNKYIWNVNDLEFVS